MKKIGFLSFGHYRDVAGARVATAGQALHAHVELAKVADDLGIDGAWVRVHHFEESMTSPFPLLAAMATATSRIEVGTGVVDLRYENPLHMAEEAAATDLLSNGRLQLGVSRGSPELAVDGQAQFGHHLADGESWAENSRRKIERFLSAIEGTPIAHSARAQELGQGPDLPIRPLSPGLRDRIWWGAATHATGLTVAAQGMNLLSSTVMLADDGRPFHVQQADQVRDYREAYRAAGHTGPGMTAVTRPVFPFTSDADRRYFGTRITESDSVAHHDGSVARSGPTIAGSIEQVVAALQADEAVTEADLVLFTMPSHLGVEYNTHWLGNLVILAEELGWR
ncbi:LLM class flavin-dependent oxidoreductase [Arachnia propionica]|uniref:LLM class flavin-dependent oxidoreductase n=1 Tax=Arachnia propionica TaxID=1750 RepID=A0A3P1T1J9_9ACTN|nr:LLM class flavin-dependent oxidoreductase [Arachnia propionica]RRD03118.1 LLM class flavin-dependent oxidoreductase [Arachnia propionica]